MATTVDVKIPPGQAEGTESWVATGFKAVCAQVTDNEPRLENTSAGFAPRPAWRPLTKFEQRGIAGGPGVFDMLVRRRS